MKNGGGDERDLSAGNQLGGDINFYVEAIERMKSDNKGRLFLTNTLSVIDGIDNNFQEV